MAESSTVARWELALRIKARRRELGINVDEIVKHLGFTRNFFSAVENERAMLAEDKLEILMELFRFDNMERAECRELDRIGRDKGWWEAHEDVLTNVDVRFLGLEQGASEIRNFDALLFPGLLQSEDYYRALLDRDPAVGRVQMESLVKIRLRRQEEVLGSSATKLTTMVCEGALRQIWKDDDLRKAQVQHVIDLVEANGNIEIRVLTQDRRPGVIVAAATLALFDFDSPHLPRAAYQEVLRPLPIITEGDDDQYRRLRIAWEESYELALSPAASMDMMGSLS